MKPRVWKLEIDRRPRPTLFVDRDGVIIEDAHYLARAEDVRLLPGSAHALAAAAAAGWRLICLTNQSGIGRGLYDEDQFRAVQMRLDDLLAAEGVVLDGLLYCPHDPDAGCGCRKPAPGMVEEAARSIVWTPDSWMVGDKASDLGLARRADLRPALVRTGYGARTEREGDQGGAPVFDDLAAAVTAILGGGMI